MHPEWGSNPQPTYVPCLAPNAHGAEAEHPALDRKQAAAATVCVTAGRAALARAVSWPLHLGGPHAPWAAVFPTPAGLTKLFLVLVSEGRRQHPGPSGLLRRAVLVTAC